MADPLAIPVESSVRIGDLAKHEPRIRHFAGQYRYANPVLALVCRRPRNGEPLPTRIVELRRGHGGSSPACQRQIPLDGAVHGSEVTLLSSCEQRLTDSHQTRQPDAQPCALSLGVRSEAECEATHQCSKNDWRNAFLGLGFSMTRLQQSRNSTSMLFLSTLLCSSAPPPLRWRTAPSLLFPLLTTLI